MAFNYVELNEEKLPKNLGVKGKSKDVLDIILLMALICLPLLPF